MVKIRKTLDQCLRKNNQPIVLTWLIFMNRVPYPEKLFVLFTFETTPNSFPRNKSPSDFCAFVNSTNGIPEYVQNGIRRKKYTRNISFCPWKSCKAICRTHLTGSTTAKLTIKIEHIKVIKPAYDSRIRNSIGFYCQTGIGKHRKTFYLFFM